MSQGSEPRGRSVTSLSLEWIAQKMRRANSIKNRLDQGTYEVNAEQVAQQFVGKLENNNEFKSD